MYDKNQALSDSQRVLFNKALIPNAAIFNNAIPT